MINLHIVGVLITFSVLLLEFWGKLGHVITISGHGNGTRDVIARHLASRWRKALVKWLAYGGR